LQTKLEQPLHNTTSSITLVAVSSYTTTLQGVATCQIYITLKHNYSRANRLIFVTLCPSDVYCGPILLKMYKNDPNVNGDLFSKFHDDISDRCPVISTRNYVIKTSSQSRKQIKKVTNSGDQKQQLTRRTTNDNHQ